MRSDLARAGFQINHEKSDWQPKPCFSWIGYTIDTYSGLICATDSRIGKLSSELVDICVVLEKSRFVHVKRIASIVGQIVSLSPSWDPERVAAKTRGRGRGRGAFSFSHFFFFWFQFLLLFSCTVVFE